MMLKGLPVTGIGRDTVKFDQSLEIVQAFPARTRRLPELESVEPCAQVVAGAFPILLYLGHHAAVAVFARDAMQPAEAVDYGQIHLVGACIEEPVSGVEICCADKIGCATRGGERGGIARGLMPHEQR